LRKAVGKHPLFSLNFSCLRQLSIFGTLSTSFHKNKISMKKKKPFSSAFEWIKDVGLKALVILLVAIGGYYAYAQITTPSNDPNPVDGVVGKFVGQSTAVFAGGVGKTGYEYANSLCSGAAGDLANSHVCTPDEIINSYNHGTTGVSPIFKYYDGTVATQVLWINNGPPAFRANANDCAGWTDPTSASFGTAWDFKFKNGFLRACSESSIRFACCK
jgi:hypothetical protein